MLGKRGTLYLPLNSPPSYYSILSKSRNYINSTTGNERLWKDLATAVSGKEALFRDHKR
jgi:hypothetical protein